eukprot:scaffold78026_cov19-Tisochrysis_lutea.AAC.1
MEGSPALFLKPLDWLPKNYGPAKQGATTAQTHCCTPALWKSAAHTLCVLQQWAYSRPVAQIPAYTYTVRLGTLKTNWSLTVERGVRRMGKNKKEGSAPAKNALAGIIISGGQEMVKAPQSSPTKSKYLKSTGWFKMQLPHKA